MRETVTPSELRGKLDTLVERGLDWAVMLWGPPGIGKSSVVRQVADDHALDLVDVRLGQLAPTDLRGLPAPDHDRGEARWYPPDFLPDDGEGILFLDELTNAARTMQGLAQQLLLSRQIGSYSLPDGWFVWAAGNRPEDRAAVQQMPSPVANRFLHFHCRAELQDLRAYAARNGWTEEIVAFLSHRPELLFRAPETDDHAWPSPRSWEMADDLFDAGMDVAAAVGEGPAREFRGFLDVYEDIPELEQILGRGIGGDPPAFPDDMSQQYAVAVGLAYRADSPEAAKNAFEWLDLAGSREFVRFFVADVTRRHRQMGQLDALLAGFEQSDLWEDFRSYVEDSLM